MTAPNVNIVKVPASSAGEIERQGFAGNELHRTGETASTAMAAQATAAMQARYVMAMKNPRDLMVVRGRLLKDCARPGFADAAIYHKPVGDGIEGPSIRMAEAAARAMTNIYSSVTCLYDDRTKRIIRVAATDLESNLTFDKDVTVPKTIERSKLKKGQNPIRVRFNSKGIPVYLVDAETDDDILNAENALASKALRVCILRLIPGDILEEALREAQHTIAKGITDDPDKALKSMCDSFELELGITAPQLAEYLCHPIGQTTTHEIALMRKLFVTLKDGETNWSEVMENRGQPPSTTEQPAETPAATANKPPAPEQQQPAVATSKARPNLDDVAAATRARRSNSGNAPPATSAEGPPPISMDDDERGDDPTFDGTPGHPRRR